MRKNFETEIRLFLASVLLENRSVLDLINADYTFVNESLARQYDIPGVFGPQFRRVTLKDENRWGLLGKGAVLLRTSYGDRTSPVLRGAWVLERIMGTPPAPPPPNVATDLSVHAGPEANHRARAARGAPREPDVPGLPWPDRPARPRAGEFRRHGTLAHRRRSREGADRSNGGADERRRPARPGGLAPLSDESCGPVPDDGDQAPDDVRAQSRDRILRHAPGPADRARRRGEQLHVRRDRHRHRQQRRVPSPGARSAATDAASNVASSVARSGRRNRRWRCS